MSAFESGKYLNKILKKKGISQTELASMIGVERQTINQHINGGGYFKAENYLKISEVLDVSVDDILHGGKERETKLFKWVKSPIRRINLEMIPNQPDSLGYTILDYILKLNDFDKFLFFYEKKLFIEDLSTHVDLIIYLLKNQHFDFLSSEISYSVLFADNKTKQVFLNNKFTFPYSGIKSLVDREGDVRCSIFYGRLRKQEKDFVDMIIDSCNKEILDFLIRWDKIHGTYIYPTIFNFAIATDKLCVVEHYYESKLQKPSQEIFDIAIHFSAVQVAKYVFKKFEYKTHENLCKIKDTRFVHEWKDDIV